MDIYLKQAILQVVDRELGDPIYSQQGLDLTNGNTRDYLINKIKKLSSAQSKTGVLRQDAALASILRDATADFIGVSQRLVEKWYTVYQKSDDAPSADAFVVLYEQDAQAYLAFLKVDYHQAFTHYVNAEEGPLMNQLIIHQSILSNKTQKADEGFAINLQTFGFELMEKKYTFSGEKMPYLSTNVIESEPAPSLEENVKVVKKAAEKIGKKFEVAKHDVVANVKEAIYNTLETTGEIDPHQIATKIFKDNISAQSEFKAEMTENVSAEPAPISPAVREIAEKKYGKQKLKLSNGIELIVPIDVYQNPALFEFVNHPDGTMSVEIKNVEEVISRL
ncbi:nucleoid-associated protein [Latilactobacillus fragifolii]|uniref:nucleoid-associated protein n=1 Tax=Latilactobacillus fragifolii TaxID=2814244 RepID=UPI001ABB966C|nr:nucleoid-associated protein [Latilactobacillus fragifolii]